MQKKLNHWYNYHETLSDSQKVKCREKACELCQWSETTFYRSKRGDTETSILEKMAVAKAYGVEFSQFFPECEAIIFD